MEHIKYRKTPHFDDVFKHVSFNSRKKMCGELWVEDNSIQRPVIKVNVDVKLHGTNVGINQRPNGKIWFQSRNRVIAVGDDNAGSALFCSQRLNQIKSIFADIRSSNPDLTDSTISIYGEFVGKGIFGTGISNLEKSLFIFSVESEGRQYNTSTYSANDVNIFNIIDYRLDSIDIDFNDFYGCSCKTE